MFKADDIYPEVKLSDIFDKISELDIFQKYCINFKKLDTPFLSEFYDDKLPDCYISIDYKGSVFYKDFGESEHRFNCIYYLMFKYSITFKEALLVICNDFNLFNTNNYIKPDLLLGKDSIVNHNHNKPRSRTIITIKSRNWSIEDYDYWIKYGITFGKLDEEEVIPVKNVYLTKDGHTKVIFSTKSNPIYAYVERDYETGAFIGYKIYSPLAQNKRFKWLSCDNVSRSMPGWRKLPKTGDLLLLTKSKKDVICLGLMNFYSVSRQSEGEIFTEDVINELKQRFKKIIIMYDNDQTGLKSAKLMSDRYSLKSITIPLEYDCKDASELVAKIGLKEAKIVINNLINE